MTDGQRGSWTVASDPGNCRLCGGRWEPGARIRHDPDAGGPLCACCGQPEEDEVQGILDQLGGQEDASP